MNKKLIKQIIVAILGAIFLGLGIGMMNKVGIGTDSLSATYAGIAMHLNTTLGTVTAIMNAFMLVVAYLLYKKNVGIATVLFIFVSKWPIDFAIEHFISSDNIFVSIILAILSIAVIALGSELFMLSDLGANAYDAMTMAIGKQFKHEVPYVYIRWAFDGILIFVAIALGGKIGLGTILSFALVGLMIKGFQKILEPIVSKFKDE